MAIATAVSLHIAILSWLMAAPPQMMSDAVGGRYDGGVLVVQHVGIKRAESQDLAHVVASANDPQSKSVSDRKRNEPAIAVREREIVATPSDQASEASFDVLQNIVTAEENFESTDVEKAASAPISSAAGLPQDDLSLAYRAALRAVISAKWHNKTGDTLPDGCFIQLNQLPGGTVESALVTDCVLDQESRNKLAAVVLMTQPLPYAGFESVFAPEMTLDL